MNTKLVCKILKAVTLLLLTACTTPLIERTPAGVATDTPGANLPNPASVYCEQQGNRLQIRTAADGSQAGICIFPDGSECDEWSYFRGECGPGRRAAGTVVMSTETFTPSGGIVIPQSISGPSGVIVDPRNDSPDLTEGLVFYNTDGLTLGELLAPRAHEIHPAGHYQGSLDMPLVFHAFELESQEHALNLNTGSTATRPGGQVSLLASLDDKDMLSGLVGVPGEAILFYIVFQPMDGALQSQFMFGNLNSMATTAPILTLESSDSRYWEPVAIQMKDGAPTGLWFTRTPWGIGGDIVFEYQEGLSYFNLASGTIAEVLPPEAQFNSLSSDQTQVAYSVRSDTGHQLLIRNLMEEGTIAIPSLPGSDRGPGDAIFSPSNTYIVWREAQGSLLGENFQQTVRIAAPDGQSVGDFKDAAFYKAAEIGGAGAQVKPVGWLTDETILVQVISPEKPHNGTVVKLNVATGEFALFAQGFVAGWFYP